MLPTMVHGPSFPLHVLCTTDSVHIVHLEKGKGRRRGGKGREGEEKGERRRKGGGGGEREEEKGGKGRRRVGEGKEREEESKRRRKEGGGKSLLTLGLHNGLL